MCFQLNAVCASSGHQHTNALNLTVGIAETTDLKTSISEAVLAEDRFKIMLVDISLLLVGQSALNAAPATDLVVSLPCASFP